MDTLLAFGCSRNKLGSEAGWEEKTRPGSERLVETNISAGSPGALHLSFIGELSR